MDGKKEKRNVEIEGKNMWGGVGRGATHILY